jgi:hypothetical protein
MSHLIRIKRASEFLACLATGYLSVGFYQSSQQGMKPENVKSWAPFLKISKNVDWKILEEDFRQKCMPYLVGGISFIVASRVFPYFPYSMQISNSSIVGNLGIVVSSIIAGKATEFYQQKQVTQEINLTMISAGLAIFYLLGGKYGNFLPSNLLKIGGFARTEFAPILTQRVLQGSHGGKDIIKTLGKNLGCHHCGVKKDSTFFVADLVTGGAGKQIYLPQCTKCADLQRLAKSQESSMSLLAGYRRLKIPYKYSLRLSDLTGFGISFLVVNQII